MTLNGKKTFTGIIVMLVGFLSSKGYIPMAGDETTQQLAESLITIVGFALAVYGRWHVSNR